jgi:hypothetical protein
MASLILPETTSSRDGALALFTPLNDIDTFLFRNAGVTGLMIWHTDPASVAVDNQISLVTPGTVEGLQIEDKTIAIAPGEMRFIGILSPQTFNTQGQVGFTASGTDVALGVVKAAVLTLKG